MVRVNKENQAENQACCKERTESWRQGGGGAENEEKPYKSVKQESKAGSMLP